MVNCGQNQSNYSTASFASLLPTTGVWHARGQSSSQIPHLVILIQVDLWQIMLLHILAWYSYKTAILKFLNWFYKWFKNRLFAFGSVSGVSRIETLKAYWMNGSTQNNVWDKFYILYY